MSGAHVAALLAALMISLAGLALSAPTALDSQSKQYNIQSTAACQLYAVLKYTISLRRAHCMYCPGK